MATIEVEGVKVAYRDAGTGEPVVLLHCTGSSGAQWRALREGLAHRFRVITLDLHGHGRSDPWPGHRPIRLADDAALVRAVLARSPGPVHLVGHSYGGAVALAFARHEPHRLRTLTLIEPVAFHLLRDGGPADRALFAEITAVANAITQALATGHYRAGLERFVDYWNSAGAWARLTPEAQGALLHRIGAIALNFWAVTTASVMPEAHARITAPTLLLGGDRSPAPTRRITERLAATLPAAHALTIAGAGHMLPLSHGTAVNSAIAQHLGQRSPSWREAA